MKAESPDARAPRRQTGGYLARWIPAVATVRAYERGWLVHDLMAGLVLCAVLAPVGMGYARAAGLPAVCGLYATFAPLLAYAVFGPSRILVLGPDSALAGLIGAAVVPLAGGDAQRTVELAGALAVLMGLCCMAAGLCRMGFIASLLSAPIRYGYLNGIALTVLVGQLPALLGLPSGSGNLGGDLVRLAGGLLQWQVNGVAATLGLACLVLMVSLRRRASGSIGVLIALVGATLATITFDLHGRAGVALVGALPEGLPVIAVPSVSWKDVQALLPGAFAIALVSIADMSVLSRAFGRRSGHDVDVDHEVIALGVANLASGLFHGFSVSSSASRTPVAEAAGARTQLTCVVGALGIVLLLVAVPSLLLRLPEAALAAVVVFACGALVEVRAVSRLWRLRRSEFAISMACFLGVALFGVIPGVFSAVAIALLEFVWRAWRPYDAVLGRLPGLRGFHDIVRHPEAERIPGLVMFRWDAPLFFANAEIFQQHVLKAIADAPTPTRWIVVAAEPVTDVDVTAADMLAALDLDLHAAGRELVFAEMKGPVKDQLKRYGLFAKLGVENFFPTIEDAVDRYRQIHEAKIADSEGGNVNNGND